MLLVYVNFSMFLRLEALKMLAMFVIFYTFAVGISRYKLETIVDITSRFVPICFERISSLNVRNDRTENRKHTKTVHRVKSGGEKQRETSTFMG